MELSAFIAQGAAAGPMDHALACLLGLLGLRVAEAFSINIDAVSTERGHRTVTILGKGAPNWPSSRCRHGSDAPSTPPPETACAGRCC